MTTWVNGAEGGSNGTPVTTGNSGGASGDAWDSIVVNTGSTVNFATAAAAHGSLGYRHTPASGQNCYRKKTIVAGATVTHRFYYYYLAAPAAETSIARMLGNSAGTQVASLAINTSGTLRIRDTGNNSTVSGSNSIGSAMTAGTRMRFEWQCTPVTTSTGIITLNAYVGEGTTVFATFTSSIMNLNTNQVDTIYEGHAAGPAVTGVEDYDSSFISNSLPQGSFPGIYQAAPVAAFTHSEASLVSSVDASSSTDLDGHISGWDWNWGDSTTHGTTITASHTYASAGTYTQTLIVTDNRGATNSTTHSVTVSAGVTLSAGVDQTSIEPFTIVTLTGTDDATGSPTRVWSQVGGSPTVAITQVPNAKTATFKAPGSTNGTTLTFQYAVTGGTSDTMTAQILASLEFVYDGSVWHPLEIRSF